MLKHERAVRLFHELIEPEAGSRAGEYAGERCLAHLERVTPQVIAIKLDQVEGKQKHVLVMAPIPDAVEIRHSVITTGHRLPVDDAGSRP